MAWDWDKLQQQTRKQSSYTAVLVSHNHLNHCNDLNAVVDAMTHSGIEHRGIVLASKSVLHSSEKHHPFLTKYHQNLVEKIIKWG